VRVSRAGDQGKIAGRRVLAGDGQSIWINEMRTGGAELASTLIHYLRKCFNAAGMVTRQTSGHVIWALDKKSAQQIDALVSVAGLDAQLDRLSHRIHVFDH